MHNFGWCFLVLGAALVAGCGRQASPPVQTQVSDWLGAVTTIEAPAAPGARYPHLAGGRDGSPVVMSWLEPENEKDFRLRHAHLDKDSWSSPATIAQGSDWFINWADFPSVEPVTSKFWVAHWLQQRAGNVYSYDVRMRTSVDGGSTWSEPFTPHDDGTPTEHGFVSIAGTAAHAYAFWLDGRNTVGADHDHAEHAGAMSLRGAVVAAAGSVSQGAEIDARVCDCCQTDAVIAGDAVLVAYRDRSENEIRDIKIARLEAGHWTAPIAVHEDGWRIDGCPVNGPAIDAQGTRVVVAWFTAPDQPRVRVAFSSDGGETFSAPIEVARGKVIGRVDVVLLPDGRAITSWLEELTGGAEVRAQPFAAQGPVGPARTIARSAIARSSGFPQMVLDHNRLLFAWTETGEPVHIRTAFAELN